MATYLLAPSFTNISLKTFVLATLFGIAPPTFAFTYRGGDHNGSVVPRDAQ